MISKCALVDFELMSSVSTLDTLSLIGIFMGFFSIYLSICLETRLCGLGNGLLMKTF